VLVLKKEHYDMTTTRKPERLPEGMVLVETADDKWFPAFALFSDISNWMVVPEGSPLIPPALDPLHDPVQGYTCREEAIEACHAWREAVELTEEWRELAAYTELYPERTARYLDEMVQLAAGDDTPHLHYGISVQAVVLARGDGGNEVIAAAGVTPDEAIENLYQRVYEWSRRPQALACASSIRSR
jgi:hypothetical protein